MRNNNVTEAADVVLGCALVAVVGVLISALTLGVFLLGWWLG